MPNYDKIQLAGGTSLEWSSANPILDDREPGVETDTGKMKFGNGLSDWNSLPYAAAKGDPGVDGTDGTDGLDGSPGLTDGNDIAAALDAAIGTGWRTGGTGGGFTISEVIDMASFTGTHEVDVTGIKTVRLSSFNTVLAAANSVRVELSADGGLTWFTGASDYLRRDANTTAVLGVQWMMIDGSATTDKILWAEIRNLDTPAPAYMEAVEFGSAHKRWETIHKFAVPINRIRLLAPAGVSGSIYLEGF